MTMNAFVGILLIANVVQFVYTIFLVVTHCEIRTYVIKELFDRLDREDCDE